jgi:hypothetical protein
LGIPAVSGVNVPAGERIVAIDGDSGLVASLVLDGDENV